MRYNVLRRLSDSLSCRGLGLRRLNWHTMTAFSWLIRLIIHWSYHRIDAWGDWRCHWTLLLSKRLLQGACILFRLHRAQSIHDEFDCFLESCFYLILLLISHLFSLLFCLLLALYDLQCIGSAILVRFFSRSLSYGFMLDFELIFRKIRIRKFINNRLLLSCLETIHLLFENCLQRLKRGLLYLGIFFLNRRNVLFVFFREILSWKKTCVPMLTKLLPNGIL